MLTKRIIACLDVRAGRVVKGIQFLDIIDAGDPAELAHRHAAAGADEIVLLDITATHEGRGTLLDTVKRTAEKLFIPFTVGGGIRSAEDAEHVFLAGADKVSINSAAISRPQLIGEIGSSFGAQAVIVAIDARRANTSSTLTSDAAQSRVPHLREAKVGQAPQVITSGERAILSEGQGVSPARTANPKEAALAAEGRLASHFSPEVLNAEVYINGGRKPTGLRVVDWAIEAEQRGAGEILLTSMDTDGMRNGFDDELTALVSQAVQIPVIASGGAGTAQHFANVFSHAQGGGHADAALAASIFHFGITDSWALKRELQQHGIPVRL